ncbi:hypothetical protein ACX80U_12015 [Arthrobacter sp. TmT3-37]
MSTGYKPLAVTSTTNAIALAVYLGLASLGWVQLSNNDAVYLDDYLGLQASTVLMTLLTVSGLTAFLTSVVAAFRLDPTAAMLIESAGLLFLTIVMFFVYRSLVTAFELAEAPTSIVLSLTVLAGCALRLLQIAVELWRVRRSRRRPPATTEVPAEPTKG